MPGQPSEGWWNDFIGPGRPLDTDRFFIVCANVLGGCQGTTGPASIDPETGRQSTQTLEFEERQSSFERANLFQWLRNLSINS